MNNQLEDLLARETGDGFFGVVKPLDADGLSRILGKNDRWEC